jgi:regulator of protease activity HflC (stomatin/prohibitin superfamily)
MATKSSSYDPSDTGRAARDAEAEQARAKQERRQELDDLRWLMAHPQGRRIAARLLEKTHVYRTSFDTSGSVMAFREGERNIGLFIHSEILEASPKGMSQLLKEFQGNE